MSQKIFKRPRIELKLDFLAKIGALKISLIDSSFVVVKRWDRYGYEKLVMSQKNFQRPPNPTET